LLAGVASGREAFSGFAENYPLPGFAETFVSMLAASVSQEGWEGSVLI